MTEEPDYDPVDCPVEGCSFSDAPRAVAAHVSGTHDERHEWSRLPHDSAREFVMAEKRRQLEAMGAEVPGSGRSDGGASASAGNAAAGDDSAGSATGTAAADSGSTAADSEREPEPLDTTFADDAMAVLSLLRRYGTTDLSAIDTFRLVNLYALLSDLQSAARTARGQVRDALLEEIQDDRSVAADYGTINRSTHDRRTLKDEEAVRAALDRAGIDPVAVMSIDTGKLQDAVEAGRLDEDAVFDVEQRPRIRRVDVAEDRREELLAGLDPSVRALLETG